MGVDVTQRQVNCTDIYICLFSGRQSNGFTHISFDLSKILTFYSTHARAFEAVASQNYVCIHMLQLSTIVWYIIYSVLARTQRTTNVS
jgi:hypothetical protein